MTDFSFLRGVGVPIVTPFDEKNKVDYQGLKRLLNHLSNNNVAYLVVHGTTGESATTTIDEKIKILDSVKQNNKKNIPIVLGLGGNNTHVVLENLEKFDLKGIEAILSVCPYYNKPSQEGIYTHYRDLQNKSHIPIIIYNVPSRTGVNIDANTTLKLSLLNNIIGIKESSGNFSQCLKISKYKSRNFMLISGNDSDTMPLMSIGACGVISVLGNAMPRHINEIVSNGLNNNYKEALKYQFDILEIDESMYEEGNPVGIKQLLNLMFICHPFVRKPLIQASESLRKKLSLLFAKLGDSYDVINDRQY